MHGTPNSPIPTKIVKHFACRTQEVAVKEFHAALTLMGKAHCALERGGLPFVRVYDPIDIRRVDFVYGIVSAREILKWSNAGNTEVIDATATKKDA
jgi:hypothetical protein